MALVGCDIGWVGMMVRGGRPEEPRQAVASTSGLFPIVNWTDEERNTSVWMQA
jgi:hypothetical protein